MSQGGVEQRGSFESETERGTKYLMCLILVSLLRPPTNLVLPSTVSEWLPAFVNLPIKADPKKATKQPCAVSTARPVPIPYNAPKTKYYRTISHRRPQILRQGMWS